MRCTLTLILVLTAATTAQAGWLDSLGRHLGIGSSDGYHAKCQCSPHCGTCGPIPPGGHVPHGSILVPQPQPTPAQPPENLPEPQAAARPVRSAAAAPLRW
jgi:hypothetical protein